MGQEMLLLIGTAIFMFTYWLIAVYCISICFHRSATHQSIALHPKLVLSIRFFLWTLGQTFLKWIGVHRWHHEDTDKKTDPHSPREKGLLAIVFGNEFYYARAGRNKEKMEYYTKDIPRSKLDFLLENELFGLMAGLLLFILGFWLFIGGWKGVIWGTVVYFIEVYLYMRAGGLINGIGHVFERFGYRNFLDNKATNVWWLAWLIAGEGWHNNHHHDITSPKLSYRKSEFDPGWAVIQRLIGLRLAKTLHPTINEREEKKRGIPH